MKTSPVTEQPNNRMAIPPQPTIHTPAQKSSPAVLSPGQPASPKLLGLPIKTEVKPVLIHPPGAQVKLNSPSLPSPPGQLKLPVVQAVNKFAPMTPAEKKKMDAKPSNMTLSQSLKPGMPAAQQQHLILQQAVRQPQIIYPPSTSGIVPQPFVKAQEEPKPAEVKDAKPGQWQMNSSSVIQKTEVAKEEPVKVEKKAVDMDSSHDEEDFDDQSPDSSMEREGGSKKGRGAGKQASRGRKGTNALHSPPAPEDPAGIQTRRGVKTPSASKRGRGGRAQSVKSVAPVPTAAQPTITPPAVAPGNLTRPQKTSDSDVYEFRDDSGEELMKTGDASRPRLIMTIKSSAVTTAVSTQPITTAPASMSSATTVVQSTPIPAPVIQQPIVHPAVIEPPAETQLMIPPSPTSQQVPSPAQSDDFAQPNNTRKSRRLLAKDGTRNSVDETIDDVIRNIAPPNQAQQANNRRTTRQTAPPAQPNAVPTPAVVSQPQPIVSNPAAAVDAKKTVKTPKKQQKDRKVSETSESENEKKPEPLPQAATIIAPPQKQIIVQEPAHIQQPQPQPQPQQMTSQPLHRHPDMLLQRAPHQKESSELLQLIDPVTGELQKMTQSKEGQYVPVSEHHRIQGPKQQIPNAMPPSMPQTFTVEVKTEEKKVLAQPAGQSVVKVSTPIVLEQPKQQVSAPPAEPTHVIKPVITQNPTYTKPTTLKTYVLNSQNISKPPQAVTTAALTPPTTVISSSPGMLKINAPITQHPQTIYNLPNIIPAPGGKYPPQPKTIVMPAHQNPPTIIHQNPLQSIHQSQPQIVHQKIPSNGQQPQQIVIHSQPHPLMQQQQPAGNLMINIPTASAGGQGVSSPRMQVKQVIQRTLPPQISAQQSPSAAPPTTVVMKAGQPHHIVASSQDPKIQTTYIPPGTKIVQGPPDGTPISYIGGREIIYVGGKQTIYPNYPTGKYTQHQPIPSPTQTKPQIVHQIPQQSQQQQQPKVIEKISSQPSVSVTHIQMPLAHQQQQQPKVYFTHSGPVVQASQASEAAERQWINEKIQPQPLKSRYVMEPYDEAHRAQIISERAQQAAQSQGQVKRSYVIENPGSHPHQSTSQPAHHASSNVNQPIIPPQNKTVIGLNQTPQILTGAVASPPLKAHLTSQQPIVTGKSINQSPNDASLTRKTFSNRRCKQFTCRNTAKQSERPAPSASLSTRGLRRCGCHGKSIAHYLSL